MDNENKNNVNDFDGNDDEVAYVSDGDDIVEDTSFVTESDIDNVQGEGATGAAHTRLKTGKIEYSKPIVGNRVDNEAELALIADAACCFDGVIYPNVDQYGLETVCIAVGNDTRAADKDKYYRSMRRMGSSSFIPAYGVRLNGEYTVYDFEVDGDIPVKKLDPDKKKDVAVKVRDRLLEILAEYKAYCEKVYGKYIPLNCISLGTVFINEYSGDVRILPVKSFSDFPVEIPTEVRTGNANLSGDVYSVMYLYKELRSGVDDEHSEIRYIPESDEKVEGIINGCLSPIVASRPRFDKVLEIVRERKPEDQPIFIVKPVSSSGKSNSDGGDVHIPDVWKHNREDNVALRILKNIVNGTVRLFKRGQKRLEADKKPVGTLGKDR